MARAQTITGGRDATAAVIPGRYALSVGMPNLPAPGGWKWRPLSSVARLESGHTPSRRHPEYWGGSIPWIGIRDATGNHGRVICETIESTNELGIENSSARVLPKDTVCLSRTASVGYVIVMGRPMSTSQDFVNWICSEELNPHFLKYVLLAEREALLMFAVGSVHQTIYFPEAKAFHICMPDRNTQDSIVEVLGSLDDKIELNRRMNETLEATARSIFKDWFIDFGPTRAKIEDRAPYLAANIWSLFPSALNENGMPEGWDELRVEDIMELAYGKALKASERVAGSIPVYGSGGIIGYHNKELVSGPSIIVGRKGTVGSLYWEDRSFFPIDTVFYVKPKAPLTFCFYHLQTLGLEGMNTDAAVPGLNRSNVYRLPVPWSGDELRNRFDELVSPIRQRLRANFDETETLATTRDFLLSKLISGEVRIKDAERLIGKTT
jgi:type I restriction enzyme S subunit